MASKEPNVKGRALLRQKTRQESMPESVQELARQALDASHNDREAAKKLALRWVGEDEELRKSLLGDMIEMAIGHSITIEISAQRKGIITASRRLPADVPLTNGVVSLGPVVSPPSGGEPAPSRRSALPPPTLEVRARVAEVMRRFSGEYAYRLPGSNKVLGAATDEDLLAGARVYGNQRRGNGERERYLALLWLAYPDRDLPKSKKRIFADCVDEATCRRLRAQAEAEEGKRLLGAGLPESAA